MFELAELGHKISNEVYKKQIPDLRTALLSIQQQLKDCDFPVYILISGVNGAGKGRVIKLLNEWLDARYMRTNAYDKTSLEERERPRMWRFWRTMPENGTIGIYVGSWYSVPISKRVKKKINDTQLKNQLVLVNELEQELVASGALIIKCWLHMSKKAQKKRFKALDKNPETRWQVTKQDKKNLKKYDDFIRVAETVLKGTSSREAPWLVVDGKDIRHSSLTVGQHILQRMTKHIECWRSQQAKKIVGVETIKHNTGQRTLLDSLDLSLHLEKKEYYKKLAHYQGKLSKLARAAHERKISSIMVFEGWDAAGKGGAIRRLTSAMDARNYQIIRIAAPTDEERLHHYLWRFWRHLPRAGKVTIYDRSWYGRVLVERIEGFAADQEWQRAYSEIVNFEEALTSHGIQLLKFWIHIDEDEQLRRFKEREKISYKQHKITEEDYRNRDKWQAYELAVDDMVAKTSSRNVPWILVEGNDKRYARIEVLKNVCNKLEELLG